MKQYKPIMDIDKLRNNKGYSVRVKYKRNGKWTYSNREQILGNKTQAREVGYKIYDKLIKNQTDFTGTLKELVDDYQEKRKQLGKVSKSTIARNQFEYNRINKYLGFNDVNELNADIIENAYVKMSKDGVSKDAIHKTHLKLKKILDIATRDDKIVKNPCLAIEGITSPKPSQKKKKETRFTKEMYLQLIKSLKEEPITSNRVVLWLAVNTGMRRGEILGLKWKYVNLSEDRPSIKIRHSYSKEKELKTPKTETSKRIIAIDKSTANYLFNWQKIQKKYFEKMHRKYNSDVPVCTDEMGSFIDPDNFSRWRREYFVNHGFAKYSKIEKFVDRKGQHRVKKSGYVGPNLHSLRHTQATLLVGANIDPKTVQARLGHSRISTTLEIYAEALEENDKIAAEYLEKLINIS